MPQSFCEKRNNARTLRLNVDGRRVCPRIIAASGALGAVMVAYRPKVSILVHSMNAGGAQKRAATIANGLARAGYEVEFVAVDGTGTIASQLSADVKQIVLT